MSCKHEFFPCDCGCGEPKCMYCDISKMEFDDSNKTVSNKGSGGKSDA